MRYDAIRERIILALYDAALRPTEWIQALAVLSARVCGVGGSFMVWEIEASTPRFLAMQGVLGMEAEALYRDRYAAHDPLRPVLDDRPTGSWFACQRHFKDREDAFFRDYLMPRGIRYSCAARVWEAAGLRAYLYLHRAADRGPFRRKDLAFLETLAPHMRQAASLHERLRCQSLARRVLTAAAGRSQPAYVIATAAGRIMEANSPARCILDADDGLGESDGTLSARRQFETSRLLQLLRIAARPGEGASAAASRSMLVARPSKRRPYVVTVAPIQSRGLLSARQSLPVALVHIVDSELIARADPINLRELFGLTEAEARLAAKLADGLRLQEISAEAGVRMPTLRTQLASIMRKLDVRRQSDVVRIVLSTPAFRADALHEQDWPDD